MHIPTTTGRPRAALATAAVAVITIVALAAPAAVAQTGTIPERPPIPAQLAEDQISFADLVTHQILVIPYCLWPPNWVPCTVARGLANPATWKANTFFPSYSQIGGTGDAYRHCLWASWLVIALRDVGKARAITNLHELNPSQSAEQFQMDIANNKLGLRIGQAQLEISQRESGTNAYFEADLECERRVRAGDAHTLEWAEEYARDMDKYYDRLDEITGQCHAR